MKHRTKSSLKRSNRIRQRREETVFEAGVFVVLCLLMLFFLYPFYNAFILAFNDGMDAKLPGIYLWPRVFTFENFSKAFRAPGLLQAAVVSIIRTFIGTIGTLVVTGMFAYSISKPQLKFRGFYLIFATIPMFISGGIIPSFIMIRNLGLYNNFLVYILPGLFSMFYAIIFMSSFRELPLSLEESAMLDGANQFTIFFRIILPISKPVFAAIGIFTAVGHWNTWMDTMLYTNKSGPLNTLAYLFSKVIFQQQYLQQLSEASESDVAAKLQGATSTSVMVAAMVLATLPITIVYPFFQKHFAKGVMIGSIKG